MQKTATKAKSSSSYSRPTLQKSTTLSRKYVRKPGAAKTTKVVSAPKKVKIEEIKAAALKEAKAALKTAEKKTAESKKATASSSASSASAKKAPEVAFKTKAKAADLSKAISASAKSAPIKAKKVERASAISRFGKVKKAVAAKSVAKPAKKAAPKKVVSKRTSSKAAPDAARAAMRGLATMESTKPMKRHYGKRIALALGCSAIVVSLLAVFVAINMPNISVKVAAMQTGIDAEYPSFVPRNYSMETVASDKSGKVTMKFVGPDNASFVLTEEKSTWDSTAVLNNYVKTTYSANYSTMHEQGVTYYTESGSAVWVNGGVLYKITSYGKNLTREQIRNLVVSL